MPQDRLEPVVARVMQMVGLGRRKEDLINLWPEQGCEDTAAPCAEGREHIGQRSLKIAHCGRARIECCECVYEHDLAVEAREMVAEKGSYDMRLVGLVAALHHRRKRLKGIDFALLDSKRRKGQSRRAFEVSRHQKAPWGQGGEMIIAGAAGAQIMGEDLGLAACKLLARLDARIGVGA